MSKKKRKKQTRQRREIERIQKTAEEQRSTAPPPPPDESPRVEEIKEIEGSEQDDLWTRFERADMEGQQALFLSALEAGELDAEYAYEMTNAIHSKLDLRDPTARARYAELLGQLRQQAPDLYHHDAAYYHENLIRDAIADARWEALPELLTPFAKEPDRSIDTFSNIIDQLLYHGQIQPLIHAMAQGWPQISQAGLLDWAINEFGGKLMNLHLFNYLETAKDIQSDLPTLLEATKPYGEWQDGWLERFIPRLTAPTPSPWTITDFGEAVDADQWHENLGNLLAEFVADRQRSGIPYSRGHLAWTQLSNVIHQQFSTPVAPPRSRGGGKRKKGKRGIRKTHAQTPLSPLVPRYQTVDKVLVKLFPFLGAQPYKAAAVVEFLPAYLHFLARLGLIHPTEMDSALAKLQPLNKHAPRLLKNYGTDPRAVDTVVAAWSEETLSALRDDPSLAKARATPPAPPPPPEKPGHRPGAIQTYTFKVTYLDDPDVWRTIEIAGKQTLDTLHDAIQEAVDFDADHLYSFYMSNRAWDQSTEFSHPQADGPNAARVNIRDLNLRMKQRFLYLFDYGDEHHFEVQLVDVNHDAPEADYPRVIERHGENPLQYSGLEDEMWGDDDEDDDDWDDDE